MGWGVSPSHFCKQVESKAVSNREANGHHFLFPYWCVVKLREFDI